MLKAAAAPEPAAPHPRLVENEESATEKKSDLSFETNNLPAAKIDPPPSAELAGEERGPGPPPSLVKPPVKRMGGWARLKGQSAPPAPEPSPALLSSPELPFSQAATPCPGGWEKLKDESSTPETPAPSNQPAPGGWEQLGGPDTPALIIPVDGKLPKQDSPLTEPGAGTAIPATTNKSNPGDGRPVAIPLVNVAESSELLSNLAQFKASRQE